MSITFTWHGILSAVLIIGALYTARYSGMCSLAGQNAGASFLMLVATGLVITGSILM